MKSSRKRAANTNKTVIAEVERLNISKKLALAKALFIKPNEQSRTLNSYLNSEISRRWQNAKEINNHNITDIFFFIINDLKDDATFKGLGKLLPYGHVDYLNPRLIALIEIYRLMRNSKKSLFDSQEAMLQFYFNAKMKQISDTDFCDICEMLGLSCSRRTFARDVTALIKERNPDNILFIIQNVVAPRVKVNGNHSSPEYDLLNSTSKSSSSDKMEDPLYKDILRYPSKPDNEELYAKVNSFLESSFFPFERFKTMRNVRSTFHGIKDKGLADRFGQKLFQDILEGRVRIKYLNCSQRTGRTTTKTPTFKTVSSSLSEYRNSFTKLLSKSSNEGDASPWNKKGYIDILLEETSGDNSEIVQLLKDIKTGLLAIMDKDIQEISNTSHDAFLKLREDIHKFYRVRNTPFKDGDIKRAFLGTRKYLNTINDMINTNCGLLVMFYAHLFGL